MKTIDPVQLSTIIKYYKRPEIQEAIVDACSDREAVGSYGGEGYGKRPDILQYPSDVFELVKRGVTSFHCSEERWQNPLCIELNMPKNAVEALRSGWDIVLDIDCPWWELSKITTALFVQALRDHGIRAVSVKFSGNKGFHIGVPFEAFPQRVRDAETRTLFPEGPRKIAAYLLDYISTKSITITDDIIHFGTAGSFSLQQLSTITQKPVEEFIGVTCQNCGQPYDEKWELHHTQFVCPTCDSRMTTNDKAQFLECQKCFDNQHKRVIMIRDEFVKLDAKRQCCTRPQPVKQFNPRSIIEVDKVLIASRHLFRAPYSYHEKSGLVSVPLSPDEILTFDKTRAKPEFVVPATPHFLRRRDAIAGEGTMLLLTALEHSARIEHKKILVEQYTNSITGGAEAFAEIAEAIPESLFPPCMHGILNGLSDGKKRALFALINHLSSVGWSYEQIESRLKEWNVKNPEPLRGVYLIGQLRYAKAHKKKILPPNCDAKGYYVDLRVCKPDGLCKKIKNPVNYAIVRSKIAQIGQRAEKRQMKSD
ncbi:hypothetical protein HY772_01525 [Candidatus Woesearchaeota archaeon]|nr:hypothetical protein [Candidatus Woesearchaeota archaeon]